MHVVGIAFTCRSQQLRTCVTASEGDTIHQGMSCQVVSNLTAPPCSRHAGLAAGATRMSC